MEWVETTGKSVEEAKSAALDQLGVDEVDAEFEVVAEAKAGFLGLGRTDARVRARVRPSTPRAKEAHARNKRRRPERGERGERTKPAAPVEAKSDNEDDNESDDTPAERPASRNRQRNNRRRSERPAPAAKKAEGAPVEDHVALTDQGEVAKQFLGGLLDHVEGSAAVAVAVDEEEELVNVSVTGDNLGHLIGPKGATLHSLQELTRTVVQRKTGARNGRILVDVAQYREKRREALERFTQQIAQDVISSGTQRILEPMNPADRKVVHDTANGIDGVTTSSEGEEPRRRVVLKPSGSA